MAVQTSVAADVRVTLVRARTVFQIRIVAGVTLLSAVAGATYGLRFTPIWPNIAIGVTVGALNGAVLSTLEIFVIGPLARLRRLSLVTVLAMRTLIYGTTFILAGTAATLFIGAVAPSFVFLANRMVMQPSLPFSLSVALIFNIVFVLAALLGPQVLISLLMGRYRHPRSEQRIVMFLDLHDSTRHAERLGDENFHSFLNLIFFDISDPVLAARGSIYRYVGDEIIITWPLERGAQDAACIACFFAITDALRRKRQNYLRAFAAEPLLRGALHAGTLVVGEMGDLKREIVMLGDTMNTAARIEEMCRAMGEEFLVSAEILCAIPKLPADIHAEPLGGVSLRGKEDNVELFALTRLTEGERRRAERSPDEQCYLGGAGVAVALATRKRRTMADKRSASRVGAAAASCQG
jgi:adenylate cyclase